jgi:membrane protein YdbS with pleckstrin-like domain
MGFGGSDMARATQLTIGWCMIAIAIIGYFCAFPELAVLLGVFVVAVLFVSPVFMVPYLAHRFWLEFHRPANPHQ